MRRRNIAVIGCGYWGKNLVRNFAELGALHTICDSSAQALDQFATLYPDVKRETNLESVLGNSEVDGVAIALPISLHHPVAMQSLLAGKDVFVEKPLTSTSSEAQELVDISASRNLVLMVGHLMLYHPAVRVLKEHIDSDALGKLYYLYSTRVNLGQVRSDEGALWRLVPHDISVLIYLLDALPEIVSAEGTCYIQPKLEDVVFITLRFPKNILAHVHASWLDPHKIRQLTVVGSKRMAVFDDTEPQHKLKIYDKGVVYDGDSAAPTLGALPLRSGEVLLPQIDLSEALLLECKHFVECMEQRTQPLSDGTQGLEVVRILESIQKRLKG